MFYFFDDEPEQGSPSPRFTQSLAFPFLFAVIAPLGLAALGFLLQVEIGVYVLFGAAPLVFLIGAIWFARWVWRSLS